MSVLYGAAMLLSVGQQPSAVAPSPAAPSDEQRIAQSAYLGRLLYALDRAAWVSSDALTAAIPKDQLTGIGGYVVEPLDDQTLRVTYYRGHAADARAFFSADVRDGKVAHSTSLPTPIALTPAQSVLATARDIAADSAKTLGYAPCTPVPFNTVVVPAGKNGATAVYLLTAQQDMRHYVMGGNYRVVVGPDGKVLSSRPYGKTCLPLETPKLPPGATPVGFAMNHLLDPVPTEIHVFASYSLRLPLFIQTPSGRRWKVTEDAITPMAMTVAP